jgi:hypothetical protein
MNKITIYRQPCNGNQWHWLLDKGGTPRSSNEAFATADEAEEAARIVGRCNDAEYFEAIPQIRRTPVNEVAR